MLKYSNCSFNYRILFSTFHELMWKSVLVCSQTTICWSSQFLLIISYYQWTMRVIDFLLMYGLSLYTCIKLCSLLATISESSQPCRVRFSSSHSKLMPSNGTRTSMVRPWWTVARCSASSYIDTDGIIKSSLPPHNCIFFCSSVHLWYFSRNKCQLGYYLILLLMDSKFPEAPSLFTMNRKTYIDTVNRKMVKKNNKFTLTRLRKLNSFCLFIFLHIILTHFFFFILHL